ncbi:MAG: hypothetical protein KIS94_11865 [Chitinophagales bacterium]|nr:hypothetical protein [Chitinophagales bacterium]
MKLFRFKVIAVAVVISLASSCASNEIGHSKDVNQNEICQTYTVEYSEADDKTEVTAFFRFAGPNGTTLILDNPSTFTINNEKLKLHQTESRGAYYSKTYKGKMPEGEYVFRFLDLDGKEFTNKLNWTNMGVDSVSASLNRNENLVILFTDDPEGRNEEVTVEISDTANTVTETFKHVRKNRVVIKADKLQSLHGKLNINIRRQGYTQLKQHTKAGGYFFTDYELRPMHVTIAD